MRYHNISKDDFLNGDGIRAVLFVSGCTHHCPECHNPVTWNKDGGLEFDESAKQELFEYLSRPYVTGITFSGGDPLAMYNREEVLALIKEVREKFPNKTVWVYTGWTKEELQQQGFWDSLAPNIDVIVEGKFVKDLKSTAYHWAGSTNQRILRKESDFLLNTSDEVYILCDELLLNAKDECWYDTDKTLTDLFKDSVNALKYASQGYEYKGDTLYIDDVICFIENCGLTRETAHTLNKIKEQLKDRNHNISEPTDDLEK